MNLEIFRGQIQNFISNSVSDAENKFDGINSLGIYISPLNGWISICINYSTKIEETTFNCPDFDMVEFQLLDLPEWSEEGEKEQPIFSYENNELNWNGEEETLNKFIFNYFVGLIIPSIIADFKKPLLVQMLDSKYLKLWNANKNLQTKFENVHEVFELKEIIPANRRLIIWFKKIFT